MERRMNNEGDAKAHEEVDAEDVVPAAVGGGGADLPCEAGEEWPYSHCPDGMGRGG
jgi:hypothetical protein